MLNHFLRGLVVIFANVNNDLDVFIHIVVLFLNVLFRLDFRFILNYVVINIARIFFVHQAGLYMLVNVVDDFGQQIVAENSKLIEICGVNNALFDHFQRHQSLVECSNVTNDKAHFYWQVHTARD